MKHTPKGTGRSARPPRVRLGSGAFVPAGAPNPYARLAYLQAVSRHVPEALDALVAFDPGDEPQLQAWAERYGFTDAWALAAARSASTFWRADPEARGIWGAVSVWSWEPAHGAPPPRPDEAERPAWMAQAPSWNPMAETETAFRARVKAYVAALKSAPGVEPTPVKAADDQHLVWLVLHHVGGWTYDQISAVYQPDANLSVISEAITSLARLVGLTLRPRPGRRR